MTRVTYFPNIAARTLSMKDLTLQELRAQLSSPTVFPKKASMPLFKFAVFGGLRTNSGSLRHDMNVISVTGIEGDYDGGLVPIQQAAELLQTAGICATLYTSASHTPDAPRWRVLCPLRQPCAPEHRHGLVERLDRILGGILSRESFTLSQSFYYGRVEGREYECLHVH